MEALQALIAAGFKFQGSCRDGVVTLLVWTTPLLRDNQVNVFNGDSLEAVVAEAWEKLGL